MARTGERRVFIEKVKKLPGKEMSEDPNWLEF